MIKSLFLIRHAKSDWQIDGLADIDRPLNTRGYSDSHKMSLLLKDKKVIPDAIITSPAIRAISTALIFSRNLNFDSSQIQIDANLYESSVNSYSGVVSRIDSKNNCVFIFGHNAIISEFASRLGFSFHKEISTCGIVEIKNDVKIWADFISTKTKEIYYDFPKNHF